MKYGIQFLSCFALIIAGCGRAAPNAPVPKAGGGKRVVTTVSMVTDIVRVVAGDKCEVVGLMGEGNDPHLYKPTRGDVKQLQEADLVFYSGLMLEGRMQDAFTRVARSGKPVYAVTEALDESYLREPPEFQGHYDPHVWMDVQAWSQCAGFVAKSLAEFDPANAAYYQKNVADYQQQLQELDKYVRQTIESIPEEQRVMVTAHDAFGYFSRAYKIEVQSAQGITTESEPGVDDINKLVDQIVERKVKAIFIESSVSQKNIEALMEGAAKRGWEVAVGGQLYSDAAGAPGTYEGTYIGMMDHNATVLARALGGEAPAGGMQGKLKAMP